jgi:hypothetical protein
MSPVQNRTTSQRVHAFIICWPGQEESARRIADAVQHAVEYLTVIYSNQTETTEKGAGDWVKVPNEWYYGKKCQECLRLHAGEIMLHITADVATPDWPQLVSRCKSMHAQYENLGVWAPDIDYTDWNLETVRIADLKDSQLVFVAQTDSIVWSLSAPVVKRLQELDYECNNFGWGIDWLAISYATANNLLVLRDLSVKIMHPKGTGYGGSLASRQMYLFLAQMTPQEKVQFTLLHAYTDRTTKRGFRYSLKKALKAVFSTVKHCFKPTPSRPGLIIDVPT